MPVSLVAAVAANRVIGSAGKLPWRIPGDLARFRRITLGHTLVMGRRTFESIGKPLDGRKNIVLSRDPNFHALGCTVARSAEDAREAAGGIGEIFVIGGAAVFALFLPLARRMYITHVDAEVPGNVFFPVVRWDEWRVVSEAGGAAGPPGTPLHRFVDYVREDS